MKHISFTGYRPQKFSFPLIMGDKDYDAFYKELYNTIEAYAENGTTFYCGGAMGFDIIAGEIVLKLKEKDPTINLVMVIPFFGQGQDFTPKWHERYFNLLRKANKSIYIEKEYKNGCYFKRDRYLVDTAEAVITYYNGKPGGTKYTLDYAKKQNKTIINICK